MNGDTYGSFDELSATEVEGEDFQIHFEDRESDFVIIAPHGGKIEPGTTELTLHLAYPNHSHYIFEGRKANYNRKLHITSHRFDEPQGVALVTTKQKALAFHGEGSDRQVVYLGGLDSDLIDALSSVLRSGGFETAAHENPNLAGKSRENICNQCKSGKGVQLELPKGLRQKLGVSGAMFEDIDESQPKENYHSFLEIIRNVLDSWG